MTEKQKADKLTQQMQAKITSNLTWWAEHGKHLAFYFCQKYNIPVTWHLEAGQ